MSLDIEAKRLDSLARNRASAELKLAHPEEWRALYEKIHHELIVERAIAGQVVRSRRVVQHLDNGEGLCVKCGKATPCDAMKKRARQARRLREVPVQTSYEEISQPNPDR